MLDVSNFMERLKITHPEIYQRLLQDKLVVSVKKK